MPSQKKPTPITPENRIEMLEKSVASLRKLVSSMSKWQTADSRQELIDDGKFMALYTIVEELAGRAGVSADEFEKHFHARKRWWHAHFLRELEEENPSLAAELDPRTIEQADVSENYPPIFDPPPDEQS